MAHSIRTNLPLIQLPKGSGSETQRIETTNTTVLLTNEEYNRLPSTAFSNGSITDLGVVLDTGQAPAEVTVQATHVNPVGALTSAPAAGATPIKAEFDAAVADVATLRTALNATLNALSGTGKPMA